MNQKLNKSLEELIDSEFDYEDSIEVKSKLLKLDSELNFGSFDRIANAIVKLAHGSVSDIEKYIQIAYHDPRDVLMMSES